MHALRLYAGPAALDHIRQNGLRPQHVGAIPAAAGGPKGLILGPIDRFVFGEWLRATDQPVHLVGASIGAWRMATACLHDNVSALERLERDYIAQDFELQPGQKRPTAAQVSWQFRENLKMFYGGRVDQVLNHPRYRLHIVTSRGRGVLARDGRFRTPIGYAGAFAANAVHRRALGGWLDRVVFSSDTPHGTSPLPFDTDDFRSHQTALSGASRLAPGPLPPFPARGGSGLAGQSLEAPPRRHGSAGPHGGAGARSGMGSTLARGTVAGSHRLHPIWRRCGGPLAGLEPGDWRGAAAGR
jgi:hypothetical protein